MKLYLQKTVKALQIAIIAVILSLITATSVYSYCNFSQSAAASQYNMCIGYVQWENQALTEKIAIQPWNFARDANGELSLPTAAEIAAYTPGASDPGDVIPATNGYQAASPNQEVPLLIPGEGFSLTMAAGAWFLVEDPLDQYTEGVTIGGSYYGQDFYVAIDWNEDNDFNDPGETYFYDIVTPASPFVLVKITTPISVSPGLKTMRIVNDYYGQPGVTACAATYGEARDYYLKVPSPYDAALTGVVSPLTTAPLTSGVQNIIVTLRNEGTADMTSCTITWSLDGGISTNFDWTGTLAPGTSEDVTLGSYNFVQKPGKLTTYNLSVTVSDPNGEEDPESGNDQINAKFGMPLAPNTYNVLGENSDFNSLEELSDYLSFYSIEGAGTYEFLFASGVYNGQLNLDGDALGVHTNCDFVFGEQTGQINPVVFSHTLTGLGSANYVVRLNNIDDVSFDGIDFIVNDPSGLLVGGGFAGRIFYNTGACDNLSIENCNFTGTSNSANYLVAPNTRAATLIDDDLNTGDGFNVQNCTFRNGGYVISLMSDTDRRGINITDNNFSNFTDNAIYIKNPMDVDISNNVLVGSAGSQYGIRVAHEYVEGQGYVAQIAINDNDISGLSSPALTEMESAILYHGDDSGEGQQIFANCFIFNNTINGCRDVNGIMVIAPGGYVGIKNSMININVASTQTTYEGIGINDYTGGGEGNSDIEVDKNKVTMNGGNGVVLDNAYGPVVTMGGNVILVTGLTIEAGLDITDCHNSDIFLAGNAITSDAVGIALVHNGDEDEYTDITLVYNSVQARGDFPAILIEDNQIQGDSTGYPSNGTPMDRDLYRNLFANTNNGISFYFNSYALPNISSDQNNFYTTGTDIGIFGLTMITDFAGMQNDMIGGGLGSGSISMDPKFVSTNSCNLSEYITEMVHNTRLEVDYDWFSWQGTSYRSDYEDDTVDELYRKTNYFMGAYNVFPFVVILGQSDELVSCAYTIDGHESDDQFIYCNGIANAVSEPIYQWYFDGEMIEDGEFYSGTNNSKLYFNIFDYQVSGIYTCFVTTPGVLPEDALWSDAIAIYVLSEPEVLIQPKSEIDAVIGEDYEFTVKMHYHGIAPELYAYGFQWYKFDADKATTIKLQNNGHFGGTISRILTLTNLNDEDICELGDYYYCTITSRCGVTDSKPFIISIEPEIVFPADPASVEACPEDEVVFLAAAEVPANYNILYQWKKDDVDISETDPKYTGVKTDELHVMNVDELDEGDYSCYAEIEGVPSNITSQKAQLIVKPIIEAIPVEATVSIVHEEDGGLEATLIAGENIDRVYWLFKNTIIADGDWDALDDVANLELLKYEIIDARNKEDNGEYKCVIVNDCETIEVIFNVDVPLWGGTGGGDDPSGVIASDNGHSLYPASPNPTNASATLKFEMPMANNAIVTLTDVNGRIVANLFNGFANEGVNVIDFNASKYGLSNGVYYYTISTEGFTATQAIIIAK